MPKLLYETKELPAFNSASMVSLARKIWQVKSYYEYARRPLLDVWKQCDDAYLCYRNLPINEGMRWTDKSDFGSTAVHDGVNMLATRLSLAMMPKDDSWLTVVARQTDDPMTVSAIQSQQKWTHDQTRTRQMVARHLKQLMVRGTSGLFISWKHSEKQRKLSTPEGRMRLRRLMKAGRVDQVDIKSINNFRLKVPDYIGPVVRVIDTLDLLMDPSHDLSVDRRVSTIVATYRRLEELYKETDNDGIPLYENLDGISAFSSTEIYMRDIEGSDRINNLNTMGVYPQNASARTDLLVPVYICYFPYLEHEGEKFFDTYFHVAQSRTDNEIRIIRVEQNPSEDGHQFILKDTMIDWFGNTAYGIGMVEKLLSKHNQLNVLEAITLEAALTTVFPAYNILSGVARDDTGISFSPGALNEVAQNALGLKFIEPMPIPQNGVVLGMQELRFWGEGISSGFGNWGAQSDNPTRSISNRETATSANIKATSGSMAIDELVEKFSISLQELTQLVYDLSRQELQPDENGQVPYTQIQNGGAKQAGVSYEQFIMPRDIIVAGQYGQFNRTQEIQHYTEALQALAQAANILPNAAELAQPIFLKLLDKLNVAIPPEAKLDPVQIAAQDPRAQQMIATQLAQKLQGQFPQVAAVIYQIANPQGQNPQKGGGATAGAQIPMQGR